jgi:hypothetical protein
LFQPAEQTQTAEVRSSSDCALPPQPQHGSRLLRPRGARAATLFPSGDCTTPLLSTAGVLAAGFFVPPLGGWLFGGSAEYVGLWFKPAGRVAVCLVRDRALRIGARRVALAGRSAVSSSGQTEQPPNSSFEFPRHCLGGLMKQDVKDDRSTNDLDYHLQNRIHQVLSTVLRTLLQARLLADQVAEDGRAVAGHGPINDSADA